MRVLNAIATLMILWLASTALASESRLDPLLNSHLTSRFQESGAWQTTVTDTGIHYRCTKCKGEVSASIEIFSLYEAENHANVLQRYLYERAAFCAALAQEFRGRCDGINETGWRTIIYGFMAEHEIDDQRVIEIVFFYRNRYFGPVLGQELIKSQIVSARNATIPKGLVETLRFQMAKLTSFY